MVQVQFEYTVLITTVFMHEPTRLLALRPDNKKGPLSSGKENPMKENVSGVTVKDKTGLNRGTN